MPATVEEIDSLLERRDRALERVKSADVKDIPKMRDLMRPLVGELFGAGMIADIEALHMALRWRA